MTRLNQLVILLRLTWTLLSVVGCETATKKLEPKVPQRTHYTMREGKATRYSEPLPTRTDFIVEWHYTSGRTEELTGFHAWDFIGQGRYSMVEVLGEDGSITHRLFDFDGDGHTDLVWDVTSNAPER